MKATFDINEIVLLELREAAVREDIAASVLVEAALRESWRLKLAGPRNSSRCRTGI